MMKKFIISLFARQVLVVRNVNKVETAVQLRYNVLHATLPDPIRLRFNFSGGK